MALNNGESSKRNGKDVVGEIQTQLLPVSTELMCLGIGSRKRLREEDMQLPEAEERAAKRLRESETTELRQKAEENEALRKRVGELEEKLKERDEENEALRKKVDELEGKLNGDREEEGESACADPGRLEPLMLECKRCVRQRATVMLWPCRHVCVCEICNLAVRRCPVCRVSKLNCFDVKLPR